jgi:RNA polymerase sigma-70 factor (ECF subfamily)
MRRHRSAKAWWVLQAQSGSHEALNELFKSVQEPLFRYIVSLVRDQHLAEDILQEVFIRIYRKLRWLREPQAFVPGPIRSLREKRLDI